MDNPFTERQDKVLAHHALKNVHNLLMVQQTDKALPGSSRRTAQSAAVSPPVAVAGAPFRATRIPSSKASEITRNLLRRQQTLVLNKPEPLKILNIFLIHNFCLPFHTSYSSVEVRHIPPILILGIETITDFCRGNPCGSPVRLSLTQCVMNLCTINPVPINEIPI